MNPNQITQPDEFIDEIDIDATSTVDDFIKELEAKEKDLHITADLTIEIEDADVDEHVPEFVLNEVERTIPPSRGESGAAAAAPGMKTRVYELEKEVQELNRRVGDLRTERNEVQEKSDRRLKDFENYKYRMDRERRGAFIDQISNLASQMLPVLDNLERALNAIEASTIEQTGEFKQFYEGIVLVNQQVNEVFAEMGVQPIDTIDQRFDPNFHEAVAVDDSGTKPPNTIVAEMLRGYKIGNRVIRHSMVKVTPAAMSSFASKAVDLDPPVEMIDAPSDHTPEDLPADDAE